MESLKKAKERAESYLYRIIDQKWNRFVKSDNRKLPKHYCEEIDWPLRFEAYSYLGNKYKNKIDSFAIELRELWNEWVELNKKGLLGSKEIFWPTVHEVIGSIDPDRNEVRFSDNELWNHISMFRAKEILGIGGYEAYFNKAKKIIRDTLTSKPHLSLSGSVIESLESFVRSRLLKSKISDYLRAITRKLSEDEELVFNFLNSWGQAKIAFLLCFGNFGSDLLDSAKRVTMELIDEQAKNGSFENNLKETCLCASTIHYMKLDSSNSICNKAIDYILKGQNKEGYWDSFLGRFSKRYSTGRNVLSTVVVLETLDLITNDKPLPIWALEEEPEDISRLHKHPRIQIDKPLSVPQGINWSDVSIIFIDKDSVEIRAGIPLGVKNFIALGFKDKRTSDSPDQLWETLKLLAKNKGEISWKDRDANIKLKPYIKDIRKRLKFLFNINDDPFHSYRKVKVYRTKFMIWAKEGVLD